MYLIDDTDGYGPETIRLNEATSGVYKIGVQSFGGPEVQTRASVNILIRGELHMTTTNTLEGPGLIWEVARVHWPSGEIILLRNVIEP